MIFAQRSLEHWDPAQPLSLGWEDSVDTRDTVGRHVKLLPCSDDDDDDERIYFNAT